MSSHRELGRKLPDLRSALPGQAGQQWVDLLAQNECPALTMRRARRAERSGAPHDPIVWSEARGANVVDVDGNVYVDLTSGFGAAALGHAHPELVTAIREQAGRLVHALGDLHPSDVKVRLLERLAHHAPWGDARVILGLSGSDAVEAALKTAALATGRSGILAFEGGYHGLSYGALAACGYRAAMRTPFAAQLNPHVVLAPWPTADESSASACAAVAERWDRAGEAIGAVLVEPIQGRGGVRIPPAGFLRELGVLCRERGAVLIADEVQTGLARTGSRWRSVADGAEPDLICAGKALGGGVPVSACLGRTEVMSAWGAPAGEALHTGTFFGNPLGCAAALAVLEVLDADQVERIAYEEGNHLRSRLQHLAKRHVAIREVRGMGMMIGLELDSDARVLATVRHLLERGYLVLPSGVDGHVLQILPPLTIDRALLDAFVDALDEEMAR